MKHLSVTALLVALVLTMGFSANMSACGKGSKTTAKNDGKACCQIGDKASMAAHEKTPDGSAVQVMNISNVHAKGSADQCTMKSTADMKNCSGMTPEQCKMKMASNVKDCPATKECPSMSAAECVKAKSSTASKATSRKKPTGPPRPVTVVAGTN